MREEWKKYLLDENKEYTDEEIMEKFKNAVSYLQAKHMRYDLKMLSEPGNKDEWYHLSDSDKANYLQVFLKERYTLESCEKLISTMDAAYHLLNISKEEASRFVLYCAERHLTMTDGIERKYGVSMEEVIEYIDDVLVQYRSYCFSKAKIKMLELMGLVCDDCLNSLK